MKGPDSSLEKGQLVKIYIPRYKVVLHWPLLCLDEDENEENVSAYCVRSQGSLVWWVMTLLYIQGNT